MLALDRPRNDVISPGSTPTAEGWLIHGPQRPWSISLRVDGMPRQQIEDLIFAEWGSQPFLIPAYLTENAHGHSITVSRIVRASGGFTPTEENLCDLIAGLQERIRHSGYQTTLDNAGGRRNGSLRAIIGLEGGTFEELHDLSEVAAAVPRAHSVTPVYICSAGEGRLYREPGAEIVGPGDTEMVRQVLEAADRLDQKQVSIELFDAGTSWTYASRYGCLPPLSV